MTFVSYAQNFEDVMLYRALKHVREGFYIDVGAQEPIVDSVTCAFYERGWTGINIEPVSEYFEKLVRLRPNDINLDVCVSSKEGELDLFEFPGTGLSTSSEVFASRHQANSKPFKITKAKATTLDRVIEQEGVSEVHFLKIDVEGHELKVLEGFSFHVRPWIIVIEATESGSPKLNFQEWEPLVLAKGYKRVYFDGLNNYYLADEHAELISCFDRPPNCFDYYVLNQTCEHEKMIQNLNESFKKSQQELHLVYSSLSWRLTTPLRTIRFYSSDAFKKIMKVCLLMLSKLIRFGVRVITRIPFAQKCLYKLANLFPIISKTFRPFIVEVHRNPEGPFFPLPARAEGIQSALISLFRLEK